MRLRLRGRTAPWWLTALYRAVLVPADYVMAMGMLRGLKRRAEAHHPPAASGRDPLDQAAYEMAAAKVPLSSTHLELARIGVICRRKGPGGSLPGPPGTGFRDHGPKPGYVMGLSPGS